MELWLLGAGAIILIAITLWIVWPEHPSEAGEAPVETEEVPSVTEYPAVSPESDVQVREPARTGSSGEPWSSPTIARESGLAEPYTPPAGYLAPSTRRTELLAQPRSIGIGAGALLCAASAVGGAWLYSRWQHERNRPVNRLRRGARDVATRLGDSIPDVAGRLGDRIQDLEDLPAGTAPMGGAATAILLSAILASRVIRREAYVQPTDEIRAQAREMVSAMLVEALGRRRATDEQQATRSGPRMGVGFGRLALIAGGTYMFWRVLRRRSSQPSFT